MSNGKRHINLLIIPEGHEPSHNFRVSLKALRIGGALFGMWLLALLVISVFYGQLLERARSAESLRLENERLRDYNARVIEIEKSFQKNRELTSRIAALAGIQIEYLDPSAFPAPESLPADSARPPVSGMAGDRVQLSPEQLEQMRVPQGRPLYGWITRGFEFDSLRNQVIHNGVDLAVAEGTAVVATATGEVVFSGWDNDLGNTVMIDHENGYRTIYGHNQKNLAAAGDKVYKGDVIALSGNTGRSSAPHLHYAILKENQAIDPSPYIQ